MHAMLSIGNRRFALDIDDTASVDSCFDDRTRRRTNALADHFGRSVDRTGWLPTHDLSHPFLNQFPRALVEAAAQNRARRACQSIIAVHSSHVPNQGLDLLSIVLATLSIVLKLVVAGTTG